MNMRAITGALSAKRQMITGALKSKKRTITGAMMAMILILSLPVAGAPAADAIPVTLPIALEEDTQPEGNVQLAGTIQPENTTQSEGTTQPSGTTQPETGEQPESPIPGGEAEFTAPLTFRIDDTRRYTGMERSYRDGYLPTIENGKAILVLPLLTDGEVMGKTLTVTPELGSTERSPFVYRNYQQTVVESREIPLDSNETEPVTLYLVRLELELDGDRYNGIYPVGLSVSARDKDGMTVSQNFTTYVTITDGQSTEVEIEVPQETKPESQPLLYIEKYRITPEPVVAGEEFTVTASICNANEKRDVQNIIFDVSAGTDQLTLLEDSSTIFWEELEAGESRELTLRYKADASIPVGKYHIMLSMTYDNEDAMTLSSNGDLTVTVTQPMRLQGEYPAFTSGANAGDTISINFQAVNLGKSVAYNVRFELDAAGLIPSGSAYVGNLEGGSSGSAEMKVFVGAKSMNRELAEDEDPYGYTSGVMTMIYEDENGNEFREEEHFSTTIHELVIGTGEAEPEPEEDGTSQWWLAVGGGAMFLILLGAVSLYRRKKADKDV